MGFFGKLFGGKGPSVPSWARDAFGTDVEAFDAFVGVVSLALDGQVRDDEIRTGSIVLDKRVWVIRELALACAEKDGSEWNALVLRSLHDEDAPDRS